MSSQELIDAQFDRAVEVVQSLPKTGPIQTDYEEKLTMYRYDQRLCDGRCAEASPLPSLVFTSKVLSAQDCPTCTKLKLPNLLAATVGNVKSPRPGIWDMLGRAKWYVVL